MYMQINVHVYINNICIIIFSLKNPDNTNFINSKPIYCHNSHEFSSG